MLTQFVAAILGISFLVGFLAMLFWKKDSPQWKIFPGFYTFLPAIISILLTFAVGKNWSLGNFSIARFDLFYLVLGLIIPIVFYAFSLVVQVWGSSYRLKDGIQWKKILPSIPLSILLLIIFVAGEEIGWRGFLQTPLMEKYGSAVGIILLGAIWGIWHAPIALRGHNLTSHFRAEAFVLYPYVCICYSFPLAFLTIRSESLWPALVFHATNNTLGSIGAELIEKKNPKREILLLLLTGTLLAIPFAFLI